MRMRKGNGTSVRTYTVLVEIRRKPQLYTIAESEFLLGEKPGIGYISHAMPHSPVVFQQPILPRKFRRTVWPRTEICSRTSL